VCHERGGAGSPADVNGRRHPEMGGTVATPLSVKVGDWVQSPEVLAGLTHYPTRISGLKGRHSTEHCATQLMERV
jgi:hypothetical protein